MSKISDYDLHEILQLYQDGISQSELARRYHVSTMTIFRKLIENGVKDSGIIFSKEQVELVINTYNNSHNLYDAAKVVNSQPYVIIPILKQNNVRILEYGECHRKHFIDEHYFDEIDTSNKAYILGLLYSDGCVCEKNKAIYLGLKREDENLLLRICKELKYDKSLEYIDRSNENSNWSEFCRIVIYSEKMKNALIEKGVCPRKSLIVTYPDFLKSKFHSHFIRGLFDGDGSLFQTHRKRDNMTDTVLSISGTKSICDGIRNICLEHLNILGHVYKTSTSESVYTFRLAAYKDIQKFMEWLYSDTDLFMERKYNRYIEYFNISNSLLA